MPNVQCAQCYQTVRNDGEGGHIVTGEICVDCQQKNDDKSNNDYWDDDD